MSARSKSAAQLKVEKELKEVAGFFESAGITVRREKLSRGRSFRVKSGPCMFVGKNHLFVDKNLSAEQQLNVLVDHLAELSEDIDESELEKLPTRVSAVIRSRRDPAPSASTVENSPNT